MYEALKLPAIFSNRDICYLEVVQRSDNEALFVYKSVEHPSCPINNDYVRLNGIISGFRLRTSHNCTEFVGID